MKHCLRIGVDLDECIYPLVTQFAEWLVMQGWDFRSLNPPQSWRWFEEWGLDDATFEEQFRCGIEAGHLFVEGYPIPGAVAALAEIAEMGHLLIVVTDRNVEGVAEIARAATWRWLVEHLLPRVPLAGLLIDGDKGSLDTDLLIDDDPRTIDALEAEGETLPVWFDRPWNAGRRGERIWTWDEAPDLVASLTHDLVEERDGAACSKCGEWFSGEEIRARNTRTCSSIRP